jgi:hypothetical protein
MTINYGRRYGGDFAQQAAGNQAGNVGDTLYIPFQIFDTGGSSEAPTGLAVSNIFVTKNGNVAARVGDSGIHLGDTGNAGDTGQYQDLEGMMRMSLRIYNTTDDTGFYDAGSQYHVLVTAVTVAGKNVNFFPAVFEIEGKRTGATLQYPKVDVVSAIEDTGAINIGPNGHLSTDSGTMAAVADTGKVAAAVWTNHATRAATSVSGAVGSVTTVSANAIDTGSFTGTAALANDTGVLVNAIWAATSRVATSVSGNVDGSVASVTTVSANAIDTGSFTGTAALANDTGVLINAVWAATDRQLTAFALDTGVANTVWKESSSTYTGDTGSVGYAQGRLMAVKGDTGAAHLDAGRLGVSATSTLDTGATKDAVWQTAPGTDGPGAIGAALDTGLSDAVWKYSVSSGAGDTGSTAYAQGRLLAVHGDTGAAHIVSGKLAATDSGIVAAVLDTGKVAAAVWTNHVNRQVLDTGITDSVWKNADRQLTAFALDTGVANTVWKESSSTYTGDTGSVGYAQGRLMAVHADTGAAHIVNGKLSATDSGVVATVIDTGKVNTAVWGNAVGEPGQEAPGVSVNLSTKLSYLYKAWRNRHTQDTGSYNLYSDDGTTVDQTANTVDDGTTFDRGETGSGP